MIDRRVDPLSGAPVVIVQARQGRPRLETAAGGGGCPFCVGGLEAPDPYDVRWFPNRWPALPDGVCEVVLYTPDHDATFWSLGAEGIEKVVRLWAERSAALAALPHVAAVQIFENRGAEVGATVAHPHGQIYGFPDVPPVIAHEFGRESGDGTCSLCDTPPRDALVVSRADGWTAWVPDAAAYPYELRIAADDHVPDLEAVVAQGKSRALATVMADAFARLDQVFDEPMPYMLWWHQRPCDGGAWPAAHVHAHVAAVHRAPGLQRFVAGVELGAGVFFNPVDPESAAASLRACPGAAP